MTTVRRRGSPPVRPPRPTPADPRSVALEVLRAVEERDAYANLVLPGLLRSRVLDTRDAAFATELSYGTLRALGTLDIVLARCTTRPYSQVAPVLRSVLRLGAYQLLHTRVAPHAAVSSTVDLARAAAGDVRAGFVNAVLRQVARRDLAEWLDQVAPSPEQDPVGHLAVVRSHPRWVVEAFRDALGGDLAETAAALTADDVRPQVHLVARPGRVLRDELLADAGAAGRPGPWSPYAVRLAQGDPAALSAVRDGRAAVQDEGSQLCAIALAAAPLDGRDEHWLDACAGPGGKAALLSALADGRGAMLLAGELAGHRARLVATTLAGSPQTPGSYAPPVVIADATVPAWAPGTFDRVLVDAPCTGLGALRRRPEARWRRRPEDLPALVALQTALLHRAADSLRPGGVLGYVVCSPHPAETAGVTDALLTGRADLEPVDARPLLPGVPDLGPGPAVQLWPHRHGTDAMSLTVFRRTGG